MGQAGRVTLEFRVGEEGSCLPEARTVRSVPHTTSGKHYKAWKIESDRPDAIKEATGPEATGPAREPADRSADPGTRGWHESPAPR